MSFFVIGGIAFWTLTAIVVLSLISFVSAGKGWLSSIALGVYIAAITLLGNFDPVAFVTANWKTALMTLGAYYLGGIIYVYFKWGRFCYSTRARYRRAVREFLDARGINGDVIPVAPPPHAGAWIETLGDYRIPSIISASPPHAGAWIETWVSTI